MQPFRPLGVALLAATAAACGAPLPAPDAAAGPASAQATASRSAPRPSVTRSSTPTPNARAATGSGAVYAAPAGLDALLSEAERRSPELLAAEAQWAAAGQRASIAEEWPDPKLRVTWWAQELQTRAGPAEARIAASQRIPWPGKRAAAADAADALGAAAGERLQTLRLDLRRRITRAWNERVRLARERELLVAHRGLLQEVEGVARAVAERDSAKPAGLMRVQVDLGRLGDRIAALDEAATRTEAELAAMVGTAPAAELDWATAQFSTTVRTDVDTRDAATLLEGHPHLRALGRTAEAADRAVTVATLSARPDFELALDWTFVGDSGAPGVASGEDPVSLTFGVDLPLSGGADRARRLEARALHRMRLAELRTAQLVLVERLDAARIARRDAARRAALYGDELLPQADEAFSIAVSAYQARSAPFGEVVETTRDLLDLRLAALRAEADRAQAGAELDFLLPSDNDPR